jgi:hypothetical protein
MLNTPGGVPEFSLFRIPVLSQMIISELSTWKQQNRHLLDDDEICYIFAVIGFVQKYVIRNTYRKSEAKTKTGASGVNIDGALYTSFEDYPLDIRYGLHPVVLKRPGAADGSGPVVRSPGHATTAEEVKLLSTIRSTGCSPSPTQPDHGDDGT